MADVFVGIGSNVEPENHVRAALRELAAEFGKLHVSPVYRNPAFGFAGDDFLNLVVAMETGKDIDELLATLRAVECRAGRVRHEQRYGPRTLDLDLLLYDDVVLESPPLPRSDILKRAFVLRPLADIAPARRHPLTGKTFTEHWASFNAAEQPLQRVELPEPAGPCESKT